MITGNDIENDRATNYGQEECKCGCKKDGQDIDESWEESDCHGIFLCFVCNKCRDKKMSKYRPEVLTGYTQADVDEFIEPEEYDEPNWMVTKDY